MYISAALSKDYKKVVVWERIGKSRRRKEYDADFSFFVQHPEGEYLDIFDNKLKRMQFDTFRDFIEAKKLNKSRGIKMYESDISLEQKILSEHYHGKLVGDINVTFFDIEVDYDKFVGYSKVKSPYAPINSISLYHMNTQTRVIFAIPPQNSPFAPSNRKYTIDDISENVTKFATVILCHNERDLLDKFLYEIRDTDLLSGWNSDFFDMPYIYKRVRSILGKRSLDRMCFNQTRSPEIKEVEHNITPVVRVTDEMVKLYGRATLDYKTLYSKFEQSNKASYALAYIAEEELPDRRKLEYDGSLYDLYRDDFSYYLEYNMVDTEILVDLEEKLGYMKQAIQMTHMATGTVEKIYGTIALAELAIINYCHHDLERRVPDSVQHERQDKYTGAIVLECQAGEHTNLGAVDVTSLYPTSIICANVSPETLLGQFTDEHKAYDALVAHTGEELTVIMENGDSLTKTTEEWRQFFIDANYTVSGYGTIFDQNKKGFIPAILETWFDERKQYKKKLYKYSDMLDKMDKDDPKYAKTLNKKNYYNRFQYIKKIQLNSLYGCLGNRFFKFFDIRMAESTTNTGREILMHMARHIGKVLDGNYAYPTDSVIYGDTDSCYFKTHTSTLEDAKTVCAYVERTINESFPEFMMNNFFSNDEISSKVKVENEIISDIGIFVKKKIYILHLVHKDGYDVDDLKIMGHSLKKTTLTKIVREELIAALNKYFATREWPEFNKHVVKFKDLLETTDNLSDYGIPGKVNGVEDYTDRFLAEEEGLRLPGRVAASMLYNICIEQYEDKESIPITSQMPVRVYYLVKRFGRFQSIALPSDLVTVPDWFLENFVPLIDRDRQVEKMVDLTLTNICNAVGKVLPTERAVMADELLVY
jgi:DNA polymerase elongation subunit (family B)